MANYGTESLRARIIERAEHWEADANDAEIAANSYKGHDDDAAVDLFRTAARSRSRALELRLLLNADSVTPTDHAVTTDEETTC